MLLPYPEQEAAVDAPTAVQPEAAVNDCGVVSNTDGALEAGDRGDEWHVVGAHGRATPADEVQDANLLQHVCENPFSALHVEDDEEDDAAYVVGAGEVTSVAEDAVAHDGDAGQRSTFRNRSGRRMAGRRVAQPSSRGGQGGSKYLKRCPARRTTVQRKCGRERGQEGHGVAWSGVVRGGAHSWERKVRIL